EPRAGNSVQAGVGLMRYLYDPDYKYPHILWFFGSQYELYYQNGLLAPDGVWIRNAHNPCGEIGLGELFQQGALDWIREHRIVMNKQYTLATTRLFFRHRKHAMLFKLRWA